MNVPVRILQRTVVLAGVVICVLPAPAGNLPIPKGEARTPETRMLTADEADQLLQRDWLFQAMGEPLLERAAKEIGWARELAQRLSRQQPTPDLSAALRELDALEQRLVALRDQPPAVQIAAGRRDGSVLDLVSRRQAARRCAGRLPVLSLPVRSAGAGASGPLADRRGRCLRGVPERHPLGHARNLAAGRGLRGRRRDQDRPQRPGRPGREPASAQQESRLG